MEKYLMPPISEDEFIELLGKEKRERQNNRLAIIIAALIIFSLIIGAVFAGALLAEL